MKIKRVVSILMCAVMLLTAIPMAAFAAEEAYVEIKFRDTENESILFGETEEVYIEYSTGGRSDYEIVWEMSNEELGKIEYATDEPSWHVTSVKITGTRLGYFTLRVKILDADGNEIASDETLVWTVEPDNRTFGEKVRDFLRDANFVVFFTTGFIILPIITAPIMAPYYAYLTVRELIKNKF